VTEVSSEQIVIDAGPVCGVFVIALSGSYPVCF